MENLGKGIDLAYMRNQLKKIPNYNVEELFRLAMEQNIFIGDIGNNDWVSVQDKLPEVGIEVLGTDGKEISKIELTEDGKWKEYGTWSTCHCDFHHGGADYDVDEVITHWKPLPELPIKITNNA